MAKKKADEVVKKVFAQPEVVPEPAVANEASEVTPEMTAALVEGAEALPETQPVVPSDHAERVALLADIDAHLDVIARGDAVSTSETQRLLRQAVARLR